MSLLTIGLSYKTAPVAILERASIGADDLPKVLHELLRSEHVGEALVLSNCSRIEAYVDVANFHGGVFEVSSVLARHAGMDVADFGDYLYVHYEQAACQHLFRVTAGLDSMVVGEAQILGQVRSAYPVAVDQQTVGRALHELLQRALSAGKRVHAETDIDRAGATVVGRAVELAAATVGPLTGRSTLIVGAGSMGALGGATLRRAGALPPVVANRTLDNAARLAATLEGRAVGLDALPAELCNADVVLTSTGSTSLMLSAEVVEAAMVNRAGRPLVILDLALPRDADPAVASMDGVTYLDLEAVRDAAGATDVDAVAAAEKVLAADVDGYLAAQRAIEVAPTVAALLARADGPGEAAGRGARRQRIRRCAPYPLRARPGCGRGDVQRREFAGCFGWGRHDVGRVPVPIGGLRGGGVAVTVPIMNETLRLGTRGSALARAQSGLVADAIDGSVELVLISTAGDRSSAPVESLGSTGVFVSALRDALLAGEIDLAVHSYKDLPTAPADGLVIAAVPERADARDALIARDGLGLAELPAGSRVGTGAPRRMAQLRAARPDLEFVPIRGNVDTRLRKVSEG